MAPSATRNFTGAAASPMLPPDPPGLPGAGHFNEALRGIQGHFDAAREATRTEILMLKRTRKAEGSKYREAVGAWNEFREQAPDRGTSAEAVIQRELSRLSGLKDAEDRLFHDKLEDLKSMVESSVRQQKVLLSIIVDEEAQLQNQ